MKPGRSQSLIHTFQTIQHNKDETTSSQGRPHSAVTTQAGSRASRNVFAARAMSHPNVVDASACKKDASSSAVFTTLQQRPTTAHPTVEHTQKSQSNGRIMSANAFVRRGRSLAADTTTIETKTIPADKELSKSASDVTL